MANESRSNTQNPNRPMQQANGTNIKRHPDAATPFFKDKIQPRIPISIPHLKLSVDIVHGTVSAEGDPATVERIVDIYVGYLMLMTDKGRAAIEDMGRVVNPILGPNSVDGDEG